MIYTLPELKLTYPFNYKDSINSPLAAKGNYCGKLPLHISGNSETTADAFGKLITPEGDTLSVLNDFTTNRYQQIFYTKTNLYMVCQRVPVSCIRNNTNSDHTPFPQKHILLIFLFSSGRKCKYESRPDKRKRITRNGL